MYLNLNKFLTTEKYISMGNNTKSVVEWMIREIF